MISLFKIEKVCSYFRDSIFRDHKETSYLDDMDPIEEKVMVESIPFVPPQLVDLDIQCTERECVIQ
jgi:hypothetical protein